LCILPRKGFLYQARKVFHFISAIHYGDILILTKGAILW